MKNLGKCFDGRHVVYRFYDADDELLYVGATSRLSSRMAAHRRTAAWWPEAARVSWQLFPTRAWAHHAEERAIAFESPRENVAGRLNPETYADAAALTAIRSMFDLAGEPWSA